MSQILDILCVALFVCLVQYVSSEDPIVSTKAGLIKGLKTEDGYSKFLGVPYAVVNESNPFGPSFAHPGFENTFEANNGSIVCPQSHMGAAIGTIQCLTLNIYVPDNASSENPLPVMVWIHGGAFVGGSASGEASNPISLLRHDVIVIAINYRLGIYGFMCLDIPEVPGNQGLKDQILALRWIKKNIDAFGGDVENITLFGESAGGMSVNLHLLSSYEKLFNKGIIESGPALSYWVMVESNKTVPVSLANELGYNTSNVKQALTYLSSVDVHTLVNKASDLKLTSAMGTDQPLTKPCVEKKFRGITNFITEHPMNINSTKARTTPIIIGHNNKEFDFQYRSQNAEFFANYDLDELFKLGFDMEYDLDAAFDSVKYFYFGDKKISENVKSNLVDFGTDFIFGHPTQRMAEKLISNGATKVYRYVFSYSGNGTGASHGDELAYLFSSNKSATAEDQLVIDRLTKLWTNFAKYGDPTPETSELLPFKWESTTNTTQQYLSMDSDFTMGSRPFQERMAFWDLFYRLYGKYQKWYKCLKMDFDKILGNLRKKTEKIVKDKISEILPHFPMFKKFK